MYIKANFEFQDVFLNSFTLTDILLKNIIFRHKSVPWVFLDLLLRIR